MDGRSPRPDSALAGIRRIRGVSWRWRDDPPLAELSGRGGSAQAGVIAQEVQAVYPDLVVEHASGYLMVSYVGLAQELARAVQELRSRANELEGLSAPSLSDERTKEEVDPLAAALRRLNETPRSLTDEDVQALVGALVEAVKSLDARITELESASAPG
jgi:hypothetical protein